MLCVQREQYRSRSASLTLREQPTGSLASSLRMRYTQGDSARGGGAAVTDRVRYWLDIADYDLETARAMLQTGRYLYVGFMCHQVIEKALKAVIVKAGVEPPRIHALSRLAERAGVLGSLSAEQRDVLDTLDPLNVQARYPDEKLRLSGLLTADRCRRLIAQTEDLYQWIRATF